MAIERIILGLDGTEGSKHAAEWAAQAAHDVGAGVIALHVVSRTWLIELAALQIETDNLAREQRAKLVGPWTEPLRRAGVRYTTELVSGDPATELLRVAQVRHADLVVIGGTHHHGIREALLGGTAHRILDRSGIPVTVVPLPVPARPARYVPIPG